MEVIVHGQTTANFRVEVSDDHGTQEFIISDDLVVSADLEREIRDCAAQEHFWNQLAVDAEHYKAEFEKIQYAQFCAHTEKYARYYLKGNGEKTMTVSSKENTAILIFSEDADRKAAVEMAYRGYTAECSSVGVRPMSKDDFQEDMYIFAATYEDAQARLLALQHKAAQLRAISAAFNTKSWSIKTMAANKRAELQSNV